MRRGALYAEGLRTSVRTNATAYGFSIMITSSFGVVAAESARAAPGDIFLFAFGAVAGFGAVQLAATRGFHVENAAAERTSVLLVAALLSIVSVLAGVAVAAFVAWLGSGWYVWLVAPFAGTATFLLVNGAEFAAAREEEGER